VVGELFVNYSLVGYSIYLDKINSDFFIFWTSDQDDEEVW